MSTAQRIKDIRAMRAKKRRGRRRDVLAFDKRAGFHRRVVNDTPGRIQQFLDDGWTIVESDETGGETTAADPSKKSSKTSKVVGTGKDGPVTGYLMEIPEEIFNEDKRDKLRSIKDNEDQILGKHKNDRDWVNRSKIG